MANLSSYVQTIVIYNTTDPGGGGTSTGVALTLSTAGSSGTGTSTSGPGGFPVTSTGIGQPAIGLAGFEGVRFTAIPGYFTTGAGSGTSGIFTLQAYAAPSSTSSSTTWVAIKDAYALAYTTGSGSAGANSTLGTYMQVDVYRAKLPTGFGAVGAIVQLPTSSAAVTLFADRYGARIEPFAASTGINGLAAFGSTARVTVSVNGTT